MKTKKRKVMAVLTAIILSVVTLFSANVSEAKKALNFGGKYTSKSTKLELDHFKTTTSGNIIGAFIIRGSGSRLKYVYGDVFTTGKSNVYKVKELKDTNDGPMIKPKGISFTFKVYKNKVKLSKIKGASLPKTFKLKKRLPKMVPAS